MILRILALPHADGLDLPAYETAGAAGMDLRAAVTDDLVLQPGERAAIPTGTIDSDFRGEVKVILANLGSDPFTVTRAMRIAQLVIAPVTRVAIEEVAALSETQRGSGGFGSTGTA